MDTYEKIVDFYLVCLQDLDEYVSDEAYYESIELIAETRKCDELIMNACSKQIPELSNIDSSCPGCFEMLTDEYARDNKSYCPFCGQYINWGLE